MVKIKLMSHSKKVSPLLLPRLSVHCLRVSIWSQVSIMIRCQVRCSKEDPDK